MISRKTKECTGVHMLTRSELPENPVVLVLQDTDGRQNVVTTERVRGGKIRMTYLRAG